MTNYFIDIPVESNQAALADLSINRLASSYPNWEPHEGNLEVVQVEAIAPMAQNAAEVTAKVPASIFRKFGTDLFGLVYGFGGPSRAMTTWLLSDSAGHTIPAATDISIGGYAFKTDIDVTVPANATEASNVSVTAVDNGAAPNGLSTPVELISALDWVETIVVVGTTNGGLDAEDDVAYQSRLSQTLTLMAQRPITADDFALMARYTPGVTVGRSVAIDGYNPANDSYNNEKYITVFVTNTAGTAMTQPEMDAIDAYLQSYREVNFVVAVRAPTYTAISVTAQAMAYPGYVASDLEARIEAAILAYLDPATFGTPPFGDTSGTLWINERTIRINKLVDLIGNVQGVNYVINGSVKVNGAAADYVMTGPVTLPNSATDSAPSTANATVLLP